MKYTHLSIEEREFIQQSLWEKKSLREMARHLKRSHSSITRELARYRTKQKERYTSRLAHTKALISRTSRGRHIRLKNELVRAYVVTHLKRRWSPEQIAGSIKRELGQSISHEAIYQYIYAQIYRNGHGTLRHDREDLRVYLRRRRKRRSHHGTRKGQRIFSTKGVSIDLRPTIVEKRKRIGDWESDTVESKDHAPGINTLVERKTGLVYITKLKDKTSRETSRAIITRLKETTAYTVTFDNGTENSDWRTIEQAISIQVFFAHPYHSWERGTNENTNGLIRDYFPKGTDFRTIPDETLAFVEQELNNRPRKRLDFQTPLQAWSGAVRD